jgi:starch phosphorylase
MGLLYQQGYFRQYLNQAGWQQESYENNDFANLPLTLVTDAQNSPLTIDVDYPGRVVHAHVWHVDAGRTRLYLLDTNIDSNAPIDRDLTDQLYGGDTDTRIRQEILLGIGGYRTLEALGLRATVFHMNEGHSAFLALEHTRRLMTRYNLSFSEARELAGPSLVFTTHTPVRAGHDYFSPDLMDRYFSDYSRTLGLSRHDFLALGRHNPEDENEAFCMTILALRLSCFRNGVSKLHGKVTRNIWKNLWPSVPEPEAPITHITNGVHFRSWISYEMNQLYDRYLGPGWRDEPADCRVWRRVEAVPAEELWRTHECRRERLVNFTRKRLRGQLERRGMPPSEVIAAGEVLDPEVLTIGFARRFATYKRATLLMRDPQRLAALLNRADRPVQIIFAGKAHPQDTPGKELIQRLVALARQKEFRNRVVFLEDYDLAVARYLVEGADVWLNTPLRPQEASGTSGMKAAANGALNLSTLDGWWDEAWRSSNASIPIGWAIGSGEMYEERELQDQVEAEALYDLLENDVVPTFYDRTNGRPPQRWIERMKSSLSILCCQFNSHRMVREYAETFYLQAHSRFAHLSDNSAAAARSLSAWLERVRGAWSHVSVHVETEPPSTVTVGQPMKILAHVTLGPLQPDDVRVELYLGRLDSHGEITDASTEPLSFIGRQASGTSTFGLESVKCAQSGVHGFTIRVMPDHPDLSTAFWPGLIAWADGRVRTAAV